MKHKKTTDEQYLKDKKDLQFGIDVALDEAGRSQRLANNAYEQSYEAKTQFKEHENEMFHVKKQTMVYIAIGIIIVTILVFLSWNARVLYDDAVTKCHTASTGEVCLQSINYSATNFIQISLNVIVVCVGLSFVLTILSIAVLL